MNIEFIKTVDNKIENITHNYGNVSQKIVYVSDNTISIDVSTQSNIRSLNFGKNIKNINDSQFYENRTIQSVTGGTGLEYIGSNSFRNCTRLSSFDILGKSQTKYLQLEILPLPIQDSRK